MVRSATGPGAEPATTRIVGRILVVDDEPSVRESLAAVLRHDGHDVLMAGGLEAAASHLREGALDLVLVDLSVGGSEPLSALADLRGLAPEATWIVLTTFATLEAALRALHDVAFAYLVKPVDLDEMRLAVARGLERRRLERELAARMAELETANAAIHDYNTQLEGQVAAATAALEEKVAALDATNQQLRQAEEQHMRFVAMVAHELRGPLALVMNYAQLADRPDIAPDALHRYTGSVVEHAQRLNRLVDDLQTATRLSTGHFDLRIEPCDLVALVQGAVEQVRVTMPNRDFSFVGDAGVGLVPVDRDRMLQAVRNLLDNAVKYSSDGTAIEVRVAGDDREVSITVRDEGAGIPEGDIERLLGAFERGAGSTEVPGSGLGLYITRGIIETHGGELRVQNVSSSGRAHGAIFTLALPRQSPDEPPPGRA